MITSSFGNEIRPLFAVVDNDSGEFIGCDAERIQDGQERYYALHQLRADDGHKEIFSMLGGLPVRRSEGEVF